MKLYPQNLFRDRTYQTNQEFPGTDALEVVSHGCRLFGYTMFPGGDVCEKHPCVIVLHGFPGHCTNHDLDQALRRMGCVVVNPFYRGAWGSEGNYTFSGLIEDIDVIASWVQSPEIAEKYHIDTDNVFLAGHSMGGLTCINVLRHTPWLRGGVCIAPYDMPWFFENGQEDKFKALLLEGSCLKQEFPTSLFENAKTCYKKLAFSQAFDDLKDRNLYFVGGKKDFLAPPADMIRPLWDKLANHATAASQKYDLLDSDHSFSDSRITMCTMVGKWIASQVKGAEYVNL